MKTPDEIRALRDGLKRNVVNALVKTGLEGGGRYLAMQEVLSWVLDEPLMTPVTQAMYDGLMNGTRGAL